MANGDEERLELLRMFAGQQSNWLTMILNDMVVICEEKAKSASYVRDKKETIRWVAKGRIIRKTILQIGG